MESNANTSAGKIGSAFTSLAAPLAAIGPAIAAAFTGTAIAAGVKNVFDFTEGLGDLSDQTGVGVGRLSVLGKAFENAGFAAEDAGTAINKMQVFLAAGADGGEKTFESLRKIGLNFLEIKNLAPEKQFSRIGAALLTVSDQAARVAAAREIFGKSGGKLMSVFTDPTSDANNTLSERAKLLERNAELFSEASIKLGQVGTVFKGFYAGVAESVAAPLVGTLDRVESINLIKQGNMFGDVVVNAAASGIEMLADLKEANIVGQATQFADALKLGGSYFADAGKGVAKFFGSMPVATGNTKPVEKGGEHPTEGSGVFHDVAHWLRGNATPEKIGNLFNGSAKDSDFQASVPEPAPFAPVPMAELDNTIDADRVTVDGRSSLFKNPGMQWGQMMVRGRSVGRHSDTYADYNSPILDRAAQQFKGQSMQFNNVFDETQGAWMGASKGSTAARDMGWGGGGLQDSAEGRRQSLQSIRNQVQWQNPTLSGGALNAAVAQEQNKQREKAYIDQSRAVMERQNPEAAKLRAQQEQNRAGITKSDLSDTATRFEKAVERLVAK